MTQAQKPFVRTSADHEAEKSSGQYWDILNEHNRDTALEREQRVAEGYAREAGSAATISGDNVERADERAAKQEQVATHIATQQGPALVEQAQQFLSEQE